MDEKFKRKTDTFWQKIIVESGLSNSEIAKKTGVKHRDHIPNYSNGLRLPNDTIIKAFCELFNVDYKKGRQEFIEAHRKYNDEHMFANPELVSPQDTFWNNLRKENVFSFRHIAKQVNSNPTTISQYFRGDGIPPDKLLIKICDLFDIDYRKGKKEFENAYKDKHPNQPWKPRKQGLPPPPPNKSPRTYKNNFWSKKRVEKGLTGKELAKQIGVKQVGIYNWFSGRNIPSDEHIRTVCKIFKVSYRKGKQEFIKAHEQWYSWHYDKKKLCLATEQGELYTPEKRMLEDFNLRNVEVQTKSSLDKKVLTALYGLVSYDIYEQFQSGCQALMNTNDAIQAKEEQKRLLNLLDTLYGEIDLFTYDRILTWIKKSVE